MTWFCLVTLLNISHHAEFVGIEIIADIFVSNVEFL